MWQAKRHQLGLFFGRRGGLLVLLGICWIIMGFGFAVSLTDRFSRPGPGGPLEFVDFSPIPGIFWMICGIVALTNGLLRRRLRNEDAWGYAALIMPPVLWSALYGISYLQWAITYHNEDAADRYGQGDSYLAMIVYFVIFVIVRIVASWTDDYDLPWLVEEKTQSVAEATAAQQEQADDDWRRHVDGGSTP